MRTSEFPRGILRALVAAFVWLAVWQALSLVVGRELLLPRPASVFLSLVRLLQSGDALISIANSLLRVLLGLVFAIFGGVLLAAAGTRKLVAALINPLMHAVKAAPVASFTILLLVWVKTAYLSTFVSFITVLPIIYFNMSAGISATDRELLEMADVFRLSFGKRLRFIYFPSVRPHLASAISSGLGFAWKSGVAAEVIGLPRGTIGMRLYDSKIYLETADLIAWTAIIIIISLIMEKLLLRVLRARVR